MIIRKLLIVSLFICSSVFSIAQMPAMPPGGRPGGGNMQQMPSQNIGKLFGRAVDSTGSGIGGATVHVFRVVYDSARGANRDMLLSSAVTASNGDFNFDGLPTMQNLALQISSIGFESYRYDNIRITPMNTDINLYSIALTRNSDNLADVVVTANAKQFFEMGVDRKIFNVDNNIITQGQTAAEVMAQIPSISVDIDGNVSVRNAAPQIFVDGRPTTLTLEQIPADIIDKVELITNPGAKFDASGGGAGILNIVLKKNKRIGYNGGVMAGADTQGGYNFGGDVSIRQGKFNVFARGMYRNRNNESTSFTERDNRNDTLLVQNGLSKNTGGFRFFNLGTDFFMDNRNTFTVSGTYVKGVFDNDNNQTIDSIAGNSPFAYNSVLSTSHRQFTNVGGQFSYRHNFDSSSHFISFDANYNQAVSEGGSDINTLMYSDPSRTLLRRPNVLQYNNNDGTNQFSTFQIDYENPLDGITKIGAGVRANFSKFDSDNLQYVDSTGQGGNAYVFQPLISSRYNFNEQVYAGYLTLSSRIGDKFTYQLGLRAERSNYDATNNAFTRTGQDTATSFSIEYPISLFPSAFLTYKINESQDFQVNYSRRINRPNFFQLLPTPDLSDPYNVTIGNAGLRPEFTNSFEVTYNKTYKNRGNFLASAYWRNANNLIVGYQYMDTAISISPITTYINASNSNTVGLELTNKMNLFKIWELTLNVNFFNTKLVSDLEANPFTNERFSWFGKINNSIKLPHNFTVQLSADYQSKSVLPTGGGGRRGGGPGMGNVGTAQGYIMPRFDVDAALRKDFKFKNNNTLTASLSVSDVFATNKFKSYSETPFMIQNSYRFRQPQVFRLNLSYRFGRMDTSIFKRRSQGIQDEGRGSMGED